VSDHTTRTPTEELVAALDDRIALLERAAFGDGPAGYRYRLQASVARVRRARAALASAPPAVVATVEAWGSHVGGGPSDGWLTLRAPGGAFDGLPEGARVSVVVLL
jgi:hypothetical protein